MTYSFGIDKDLVKLHFDRGAATYDEYAEVQAAMAKRLADLIPPARQYAEGDSPLRVMEIGCGTGRLSERLVELMPAADFTFVDLSETMLSLTRERIGAAGSRSAYIAADAEEWTRPEGILPAGAPFDLLVTGATVQWFDHPPKTTAALARLLLAPGGAMVFSTFGPGTFAELHDAYRVAEQRLGLPPRPHGQPMAAAADWQRAFAAAGLPLALQEEACSPHYPTVRAFLRSVQRSGAGNALRPVEGSGPDGRDRQDRRGSLGGRALLQAMEQAYADRYATADGSIRATYQVFYGIAWGMLKSEGKME